MNFRVLRASGVDAGAWQSVLDGYPAASRDLHYSPEYGLVYRDTYGHEPMLAVMDQDGRTVMQAFVRRRLDDLPFLAGSGLERRHEDVATPYGFGGPLLSHPGHVDAASMLRAFDACWREWCISERIASEFVCLHPLLGNAGPLDASGVVHPQFTKEVVVIDLDATQDALWSDVSRGTRSSIQRARREGIAVEQVAATPETIARFHALYIDTMTRVGASPRWMFPETYFRACCERLGDAGSALFFAFRRGELAAAYLVIRDTCTAYYHFGASDERFLALRPNNLLMYETLCWAKRVGCTRYHLGGGVTTNGNDSLLRFKSSFGGHMGQLYTYGRIMNADVYRELCELKRIHEARQPSDIVAPDFFPFYRR